MDQQLCGCGVHDAKLGQLAKDGEISGGFSQVHVQELMTTKDMLAAMKKAASRAAKYAAPNKK
jgi:hypothetical protein